MELKEYYEAKERAEKSLHEFLEKNQKIDQGNVMHFDQLTHTIKSLCCIIEKEEGKMMGGGYGANRNGYNDGGVYGTNRGGYGEGGNNYGATYPMRSPYTNTQPWYGNDNGSNIEHLEAAMRMTNDPTTRESLRMMIERERMNHNR